MSEPLNSVETEDVLSSLRRLVAEGPEDRTQRRIEPRDRLILTPALRVVTPDSPADDRAAPVVDAPAADTTADWLPEVIDLAAGLEDDLAAAVEDHLPDLSPQDEAVLREIIRDVIREELQGALGERITRNLRKLVRAEVARSQMLRDIH